MQRRIGRWLVLGALVGGFAAPAAARAHGNFMAECSLEGTSADVGWWTSGAAYCTGNHNLTPFVLTDARFQGSGNGDICVEGTVSGSATIKDAAGFTLISMNLTMSFLAGHGVVTGAFSGAGVFSGHSGSVQGWLTTTCLGGPTYGQLQFVE